MERKAQPKQERKQEKARARKRKQEQARESKRKQEQARARKGKQEQARESKRKQEKARATKRRQNHAWKLENRSPEAPKSRPEGSKIEARRLQNRARRPLGAHRGPMLYQRSLPNTKKTARKRPRAPKRAPRPSQTFPKWGPRRSQIHFFGYFRAFIFLLESRIDF